VDSGVLVGFGSVDVAVGVGLSVGGSVFVEVNVAVGRGVTGPGVGVMVRVLVGVMVGKGVFSSFDSKMDRSGVPKSSAKRGCTVGDPSNIRLSSSRLLKKNAR
jgi:hypothetical protein